MLAGLVPSGSSEGEDLRCYLPCLLFVPAMARLHIQACHSDLVSVVTSLSPTDLLHSSYEDCMIDFKGPASVVQDDFPSQNL